MILKVTGLWRGILTCELNFESYPHLLLEKSESEKKLLMNYPPVKTDP